MLQKGLLQVPDHIKEELDWGDFLPDCSRKDFWRNLDDLERLHLKEEARSSLREPWPALPAILYLDFYRTGNRIRFEIPYFRRRILLMRMVMGYCAGEDSPEMLDGIINAVCGICEELTWVVPAHNEPQAKGLPPVEPETVDLFAANTSSLLALTVHMLKEPLMKAVPSLIDRINLACTRRCLAPYMENDHQWWQGFHSSTSHGPVNNWNPWITANFLYSLFLLPGGTYKLKQGTGRAANVLNHYLDLLTPDGGCNEGPSYWNHAIGSLYDCLEVLDFVSGETQALLKDQWFKKAASYLERMHIRDDYYINFADSPGRLPFLPFGLIRRMGEKVGNQALTALGERGAVDETPPVEGGSPEPDEAFSVFRAVRNLRVSPAGSLQRTQEPEQDLFKDLQIGIFRSQQTGLLLACKGGHNDEGHNHNDIGQFILYGDGEPLLIDPGVGDYVRETFNQQRYTLWTMQSGWHNLPRINQKDQSPGESYRCDDFSMEEDRLHLSMGKAYPEEAGILSWVREWEFHRNASEVTLTDRYSFRQEANQICWNFIFLGEPRLVPGQCSVRTSKGVLTLSYPAEGYTADRDFQEIPKGNHKLGFWKAKTIWRVRLQHNTPLPQEGEIHFAMNYKRNEE